MEANYLRRLASDAKVKNILVDLERLEYIDSVMIDSLLKVLNESRQRDGMAAFCNVSEKLHKMLISIKLGDVWPNYATREEALKSLRD